MNARHLMVTGLVVSILAAPAALAQGVGNLGSLPTQFQSPVPITGWSVDSGNAAYPWVPVQIDPTGPQWIKKFTGPNGQPFTATPGQTFTFQELLEVAPTQNWTDWHEQILNPGWEWVPPAVLLVGGLPAPGLSTVFTPGTPSIGGGLDFYFNPLVPGTQVIIRKVIQYTGISGTAFNGTLEIAQYPTPEPASLLMLAGGGLLLLRRRGRLK